MTDDDPHNEGEHATKPLMVEWLATMIVLEEALQHFTPHDMGLLVTQIRGSNLTELCKSELQRNAMLDEATAAALTPRVAELVDRLEQYRKGTVFIGFAPPDDPSQATGSE